MYIGPMDIGRRLLIDLSNAECDSGTLNDVSLLETLRSLSHEEAASTDTYEGRSAWAMAIHVLYFKRQVAIELGASVPPYTYEETDFPPLPKETSKEAWERLIGEIETTHVSFTDGLAEVDDERLAGTYEKWDMPLGEAVTWVISHDTYHNAQIRNMGLAGLKEPPSS